MRFERIPPPPHICDHVRYFWYLEGGVPDTPSRTFGTIADGCPGLIVQDPLTGAMQDGGVHRLPDIFIYGQAITHRMLVVQGGFRALGIYFQPTALRSVFGMDADELTDGCADLQQLAGGEGLVLAQRLMEADAVAERVELLTAFVHGQASLKGRPLDPATRAALHRVEQGRGSVLLKDLQEASGLSERTLERRFKGHIGLPPLLFTRIRRFQSALGQLRAGAHGKLSDIAFENDYADQSHWIRSFREFAGFAPLQYGRTATEWVENFVELTPSA